MSKLTSKDIYTVPGWMHPYLPLFNNTGGNDVEELLHDDKTTPFANVVRYLLIVSVRSQFDMLTALHSRGVIWADSEHPARVTDDSEGRT